MAFISCKMINGKKRYYLEESMRLPDGEVKKYSIYLKDYNKKSKSKLLGHYKERLNEKILREQINWAVDYYKKDPIFNEGQIKRLEEVKLDYKRILNKLSKNQLSDVIDRFTVNFTYESNAIEGNSLTLKDVAIVIHEKKVIRGKDLREVYETINTRKAMELVFKNKLKINEADIIKLHKILVKDTEIPLGYKTVPNFILGRRVETTSPENVNVEMQKAIEWYNKNKNLHPLQRAAILHGMFEKIHPFEDGNGRVGRLLINIILISNGYPPLIIRKTQRISYFDALQAFDNNHRDKLYRFLIEKYKDTHRKFFQIYMKYI